MAALTFSVNIRAPGRGICFCCGRRDDIGIIHSQRPLKIVWSCFDHALLVRKVLAMPQDRFDIYEERACAAAGAKAGKLLVERFKTTDMANLTPAEWMLFCETMIREFGNDLARRLASAEEVPF